MNKRRVAFPLLVLLLIVVIPAPAFAQSSGGGGDCFLGICDPEAWLRDVVNHIVAGFLGGLISGIGGAITTFPNDIDFLLRTPEALSYRNDTVMQFAAASQLLANGLLAVITLVGGFNVLLRPYLGSSYASALEVLPRLLLGAILINTARWWTQLAIDVNNAFCRRIWRRTAAQFRRRAGPLDAADGAADRPDLRRSWACCWCCSSSCGWRSSTCC